MNVYARDSVPDELLDAARVDGASEFRSFLQVAVPLMRPAIVTVLLLSVVSSWNNYFLPLAMLSDSRLYPVTVGIGQWQSIASANNSGGVSLWSVIILGSLVSVIPLVIAFLSLQRYWRGGLAIGSLK
jgi:multiple sugar transport system permease protein